MENRQAAAGASKIGIIPQLGASLEAAGIRVHLDDRGEKANLKIRAAQLQKIPYMLVVGDREAQSGQVAVRNRKHGDQARSRWRGSSPT
jgi:threonyl-tRNA synthetase